MSKILEDMSKRVPELSLAWDDGRWWLTIGNAFDLETECFVSDSIDEVLVKGRKFIAEEYRG